MIFVLTENGRTVNDMLLIDADAICKECIDELLLATCENCVIKEYKLNKSINAVPVVRCKDCALQYGCKVAQRLGNDGFCSYGERKDGDSDGS